MKLEFNGEIESINVKLTLEGDDAAVLIGVLQRCTMATAGASPRRLAVPANDDGPNVVLDEEDDAALQAAHDVRQAILEYERKFPPRLHVGIIDSLRLGDN